MGYRLYPRVEAANDGHEPVTKFHTIICTISQCTGVGQSRSDMLRLARRVLAKTQSCYRPSLLGEEEESATRTLPAVHSETERRSHPHNFILPHSVPKSIPGGGSGDWRLGRDERPLLVFTVDLGERIRLFDAIVPTDLPNAGGW